MSRRSLARLLVAAVVMTACTATGPAPLPSPSPSPSAGTPRTVAELRVAVIDQLGPLWYCDPDFFPVRRDDEAAQADLRFNEVKADPAAYATIAARLGIDPGAAPDAAQKLAAYRLWKQLNAIVLDPIGDGRYRFDYLSMPAPGATEGRRTAGTISSDGSIVVEQQAPAGEPICPICLARGTRIATPDGEIAIETIRVGMRVWSIDAEGRRFAATVVMVGQTPVAASHEVVRLVLDDGRVVRASPGHPLADGRLLGAVRAGDRVDGATVLGATLERYAGGSTFDLLPSGPTSIYLADGIALGSTLRGEDPG